MAEEPTDPTLFRLEDQLRWYGEKSAFSKRWYVCLRIVSMISAATIPITSSLAYLRVTSVLGALIVVIEGIQQLNSFHENWIRYRATSESLKHEKYLYLGAAGPYRSAKDPKQLLAERVEELVSTEHSRWTSEQARAHRDQTDVARDLPAS